MVMIVQDARLHTSDSTQIRCHLRAQPRHTVMASVTVVTPTVKQILVYGPEKCAMVQ